MTSPDIPVGHIDDGELARYLDNELGADAVAHLRNHLATCPDCQARLEAVRTQSESFHRAMASLDLPPIPARSADEAVASIPTVPSSPTVGWGWRLAAMLAVVVGITLTVTPARALLLDTLSSIRTLFEPSEPPQPALPESPVTASSVLFAVTDTVLFIDFATRPQTGTLTIERGTSDTEVTATMEGGSGQDELVVFGTGVRVVNTAQSTSDYSITLPSRIVLVEVRIDRAVVARHRPDAVDETWMVSLAE